MNLSPLHGVVNWLVFLHLIFAVLLTTSKFVTLPVPEILRGTQKFWESRDRATPFFWKFEVLVLEMCLWECQIYNGHVTKAMPLLGKILVFAVLS